MMRKLPFVAIILTLVAVGIMIRLGFWQLERKAEKEDLLMRYSNASSLPEISYPIIADPDNLPLFRRSSVNCFEVVSWSSAAGINARGESGLAHSAQCKTAGAEGPGAEVTIGWTKSPKAPTWTGGLVSGIISEGRVQPLKLVAQQPIEGLEIIRAPDPSNIPNNHLVYAIQWFIFAFFGALISGLAISSKMKASKDGTKK